MPSSVLAAEEDVCKIVENDIEYATLYQALGAVQSGQTIRLLENIDYNGGIVIEDKSITFDLNECTLNVVNPTATGSAEEISGLYVKGNATVVLTGDGEFNVTGAYGVYAECETGEVADATVTNATGTVSAGVLSYQSKVTVQENATSSGEESYGVDANFENAEVTVEGDVIATGYMSVGVIANSSAIVTIKGNISVNGSDAIGIEAYDEGDVTAERDVTASGEGSVGIYAAGSYITVAGNVAGDHGGAYATASSHIGITGDVRSLDVDENSYGVQAGDGCHIEVGGNVWSNGRGACIQMEPGEPPAGIAIGGAIEAPEYVRIGDRPLGIIDGYIDFAEIGYRIYTDLSLSPSIGGVFVAEFAGGSGSSEEDSYLIAHADQLYNVRNHLDKHFKLIEDIDLSGYSTGEGWEPIGDSSTPFTGSFDGGEHTISGLVINRSDNYQCLFGCTGVDAEIRDLGLTGVNVTGRNYVGGLIGWNNGLITNSYVTGDVTGDSDVGGLMGQNEGSIIDSYFTGTVTADD
jgi:hypothetical protein